MNDLLPWRVEIKEGPHSAGGVVLWFTDFQRSTESILQRDRTTLASPLKVLSIHPSVTVIPETIQHRKLVLEWNYLSWMNECSQ